MRNIFLITILGVLLFIPLVSLASNSYTVIDQNGNRYTVDYEGLVPCGKNFTINGESVFVPCTFCHLFIVMNTILDFALVDIVPPLAALMMVIAGIMFFFAGTSPSMMSKSKTIFYYTIIGLAIIYGSWIIINTTLTFIGVADWTGLQGGWFTISCPISPIYVPH